MKYKFILFIGLIIPFAVVSRDITVERTIYWEKINEVIVAGKLEKEILTCDLCMTSDVSMNLPELTETFDLGSNEYIKSVRFTALKTEAIDNFSYSSNDKKLITGNTPKIAFMEGLARRQVIGRISFIPLILKGSSVEKVVSFEITVETGYRQIGRNLKAATPFKSSSVLASGEWYKIEVDHNAVYKLSYKYLEQQGIDVKNLDPRTIAIYGNGGGMLPRMNNVARYDDLEENAILVQGESDGQFNKDDYILFYGAGPNTINFNTTSQTFTYEQNVFSDVNYYFLRINGANGKRIQTMAVSGSSSATVTAFDHIVYYESDKENLMKSGDDWVGEVFDIQTQYTFPFSFPNLVSGEEATANVKVVTGSKVKSSWTLSASGTSTQIDADAASGGYGERIAWENLKSLKFNPSGNVINISLEYQKPTSVSSARGWLDWIEVTGRRRLTMNGDQMEFRDSKSVGNNFIQYELGSANQKTKIWEITDRINPVNHQVSFSGNKINWVNDGTILRTYIAIENYDSSMTWSGSVPNQNLHAESNYDFVIISHPTFLEAANRLKMMRENEGLRVVVVTPQEIYNEFSSGSQDIVALRDFVRMLYQKATSINDAPRYLLLLGDGSFDNKSRIGGNTNFIPTFESDASYEPIYSHVSDDFFCVLDSNEGAYDKNIEFLDVGVGRIPAQSLDQANKVIDKIERYASPKGLGDWRNILCFVADDEDNNTHMRQSNGFTKDVQSKDSTFNIEKIFIDAYKQYSTPGGQRYPDAQEEIQRQVERGVLIINYSGHGGEVGWAHERILTMDEINTWTNKYNMPVFLTATCEFSRWDDPQRVAGGEVVLMNPAGGGIALLTTVRLVFSSDGQSIVQAFYDNVFEKVNGELPRLGDVYQNLKNDLSTVSGAKKFTLLGDPSVKIAFPEYNVLTDSINGIHISQIDTVRALGLVEVKGHLTDDFGYTLSTFNGTIYPTVYDKSQKIETLNNDGDGAYKFDLQNKKLFKGKASVINGEFKFQFIVPKDIAYNYGPGKMSYYSENQSIDANGYSFDFIVGGTDANAAADNTGPTIELFLNDESFVYGGITDENPILIAKLFDEHGINMAGTGIGHDISAIIDGKTEEPIVLNDYYSAEINSYQEGSVKYPLQNLSPGPHTLTIKVWDVYNNSSDASVEFIVQEYQNLSLNRVLNYPNPFTTNTTFWFEHNQPSTVLDVKIQIFTISGKIVKTIEHIVENEGFSQNQSNPISWNGRDEYGDKLGRGVYIYKLQVRSRRNGTMAEKLEKLVIL